MTPEDDFVECGSEEDDSGEEIEDLQVGQQNGKKRKHEDIALERVASKKSKKKEKPPTVEEIRNWKETENLYSNNLFRLQIEELLSEIRIKNKRHKNLLVWLKSFESSLKNLSDHNILLSYIKERRFKKRKMTEDEKLISKLTEYKQLFKTDQDLTLKFTKPEAIEKFGLYEYKSSPVPEILMKINLVIPKDCFDAKDFLNNRYLCRRYYYLLYIAENLKTADIVQNINITFHDSNFLLPVLQVEPKGCDKTCVVIYASPSQDTFKGIRFLPETNNVKQDVFDTNIDKEVLRNSPTPFYNSVLAHDVRLCSYTKFVKDILLDQTGLQEAIKLLCVWLKQRELNIGAGSFSEDLVLYFIMYLYSKNKINKYMSSYQVARNFWNFIATHDLENNPISMRDVSKDVLGSFTKYFKLVCIDNTGFYNVAAFLNVGVYKKLKTECQWAMDCLNANKSNSFQQLFLTKSPFYLQFDLIVDLTVSLPLQDKYDIKDTEKAKFIGYKATVIVNYITLIYQRALSKRITNLVPRLEMDENNVRILKFYICINLNPEQAFNFIELGPALSDHFAAADFRKFWGNLSSDRRFRDGSTNVCVYFRTNTIKGKRNIVKKILKFVEEEKLFLKSVVHYDQFEEVLVSKKLVPCYPSGTNEETCLKIIQASDDLGKKLRALPMSLKITGIQSLSQVYNFTELFPPFPANYETVEGLTGVKNDNIIFLDHFPETIPRYIQPVENVLHLEHSSKWPNDLQALRSIKTSFYLEMMKILRTTHNILSRVSPDFIDVYHEGIIFRYRLYVPRELALMKKKTTETGLLCYRSSLETIQMENTLDIKPKVMSALKGVQAVYPSFGPGTALVKRWLRAQFIDDSHFPDIVIDLLSASLYLNRDSVEVNTPQLCFLRFLKFFSDFDWVLQMVVVNFNEDLTRDEISDVETKMQENRQNFPTLYVLTSIDKGNSVFTREKPTKEVLNQIKRLTKSSLNFLDKIFLEQNRLGLKFLFIPNLEGYNLLIHLKPALNARRHQQIVFADADNRVIVEKYKPRKQDKLPIVDFDPVAKYLSTLRENYGAYALFFHDTYGGDVIGVLWHPKVFETVDFKVQKVNARMLQGDKVVFNTDAVIEDFYILGKGLVKMIDIK